MIERAPVRTARYTQSPSIERVFQAVGEHLGDLGIQHTKFGLPFPDGIGGLLRNITVEPPAADVYHITGQSTYYSLRLPPERTILTFHDLIILRKRTGIRRSAIKKLFIDIPTDRAAAITAISQATKDDLINFTGCDPAKITVIDNPLSVVPEEHIKPFNADQPRLLQIGGLPHKNIARLAAALRGISARLAIIGSFDDDTANALRDNKIEFERVSAATGDDVLEQYRLADAVTFFSTFEGFGLPIIEAQAMGVPVLTSNIEPMRSVAGDGALFADPLDVDSMRSSIERLIANDAERESAVAAGRKNIERFRPELIAARYAEVYRRVAESSK